MLDSGNTSESSNRFLLLALFVTGIASQAYVIISGLLLIEIGHTFNVPVGIAGQLTTAATSTAIITALVIGVLSTRYPPRTLLLSGVVFYVVSALGCYLAQSFWIMLFTYALSGAGGAIVFPMLGTIIGENLQKEERSRALGLITAGQPVSYVIGSPIVSFLAARSGWRYSFLGFMLPVVLLTLIIVYIGIPRSQSSSGKGSTEMLSGFRGVLSSRSAISCLIGTMFFQASMWNSFSFMVSYFREVFFIETNLASMLLSAITVLIAIGCVTTGSLVKWFGGKKSAVSACLLLGVFGFVVYNYGSLWISLSLAILWGFLAGVGYVSGDSLTLDQVPEYRGTLMSLNTVARNLGSMSGAMIGGYLLISSGYGSFGLVLGGIGIIASLVYGFLVSEKN